MQRLCIYSSYRRTAEKFQQKIHINNKIHSFTIFLILNFVSLKILFLQNAKYISTELIIDYFPNILRYFNSY